MKGPVDHPFVGSPIPGTTVGGMLSGLRRGLPDGRERFAKVYGPYIYHQVSKKIRNHEEAMQVTQDTLYNVFKGAGRFVPDGEPASFRRWVASVASNRASQHLRERKGVAEAIGGDDGRLLFDGLAARPQESEEVERRELAVLYRDALEEVRPHFIPTNFEAAKEIVVDGRPVADVAARYGTTSRALHTACSRFRKRLREVLVDEFPDLADPNGA